MQDRIERVYRRLEKDGWKVVRQGASPAGLPAHLTHRYHDLPAEWAGFAGRIRVCANADETTWFLCANDFEEQSGDAFRWDELERISLQAALDDKDAAWQSAIESFWNDHLPICLSVADGYGYYAIRMSDGAVVQGSEPEFEETAEAAPSFAQFLEMICAGKIVLGG